MGLGVFKRRKAAARHPAEELPPPEDTYSQMTTTSPRLVAMAVHDKHWLWSTHLRADSAFAVRIARHSQRLAFARTTANLRSKRLIRDSTGWHVLLVLICHPCLAHCLVPVRSATCSPRRQASVLVTSVHLIRVDTAIVAGSEPRLSAAEFKFKPLMLNHKPLVPPHPPNPVAQLNVQPIYCYSKTGRFVQIDNPTFSPSFEESPPFKAPQRIPCDPDPPAPSAQASQALRSPTQQLGSASAAPPSPAPRTRTSRLRAALSRAFAAWTCRRHKAADTSDAALRALPAGTLVRCVVHVDRTGAPSATAASVSSDAADDSCDLRGPGTGQSFGVRTAESSTEHVPPTPVPPLPLKFPQEWLATGTAAVAAIPGFASIPSARGRECAMVLAIEAALNRAYQDKDVLAGCYMLLGPSQRWRDAAGIVQVRAPGARGALHATYMRSVVSQ